MSNVGPNDPGQLPAAPQSTEPLSARIFEALFDFYFSAGVDGLLETDQVDAFSLVPAPVNVSMEKARAQKQPTHGSDLSKTTHRGNAHASARAAVDQSKHDDQAKRQTRPPLPGSPRTAPASASPAKPTGPSPTAASAVIPGEEAVIAARVAAKAAQSLDELRQTLSTFDGCNLRIAAKKLVFGDGDADARVMFVGEPPDRDEDLLGKPLGGRPGQLFDRILATVGLDRQSVYTANVIPWRPPGGRTPSPQEVEICKPFIFRQIELVKPEILVFLGGASTEVLSGVSEGILKLRGRWLPYAVGGREIRAMATLTPAHLLRYPAHKRLVWRDFLEIQSALAQN